MLPIMNAGAVYCLNCQKTPKEGKLSKCSVCHLEYYCSTDCQNAHWKTHKAVCKEMKERGEGLVQTVEKQYVSWAKKNPRSLPNEKWKSMTKSHDWEELNAPPFNVPNQDQVAVDLGCGSGNTTHRLLSKGWKVIAVDYFESQLSSYRTRLEQLREKFPTETESSLKRLTTQQADLYTYEIPKKVDLIVAGDVLPYINPIKVGEIWNRIFNALKEGGYFIGTFFAKGHACEHTHGAWVIDDIETVKTLLVKSSYEVISCKFREKIHIKSSVIEFIVKKPTQTSEK